MHPGNHPGCFFRDNKRDAASLVNYPILLPHEAKHVYGYGPVVLLAVCL